MVYDDAEQYYREVRKEGKALIDDALGSLLQSPSVAVAPEVPLTAPGLGTLVAFNTTMFPRLEVARVPLAGSSGTRLKNVVVQTAEDGKSGYALMQAQEGLGLSVPRGLYADCSAASGENALSSDLSRADQ